MSIAVAAFVLSVLALAWNVTNTVIRWPRIDVHVSPTLALPPSALDHARRTEKDLATVSIRLVVVNSGAEAATIAEVGLIAQWGEPKQTGHFGVDSD